MNVFLEKQHSPWQSMILLLLLTFACSIGVQFLVVILGLLTSSSAQNYLSSGGDISSLQNMPFFTYALLASSTFSTFYLPSVILQKREPYFTYFPIENSQKYIFYAFAVAILLVFSPLMELIGEWNAHMSLPENLKGLESWMRTQEDASGDLIKKIVMVDNIGLLLINIIVMAVFPAIAEEYYFRGSIMHILERIVKNQHVAIWLTAAIFSAIHFQFFGFFPRLILGVFFGYMLVWTNNIWVPIVGHFVNNAAVTILAYYYTTQGKSFEDLQSYDNYSIFVYLGSLFLTIAVAVLFNKKSKSIHNYGERLG